MRICNELNIEPSDLLDQTAETVKAKLDDADSAKLHRDVKREALRDNLVCARVEAHRRKRLFRAQQIQRHLLGK